MCQKSPERRKVGDTLTATVDPADTEIKEYQWYADGEAIEGATDDELLVTADLIGAEISVAVKATSGDFVFSDETAAVVALEGAQIINAEQSGTNTIRVEFSEAISVDDTIEVFKGTAEVAIEDIDYDGDFEGATLTMKDKITAAEYTVVLTPDEEGVDPSEFTFEGEVSELGEIVFLNNYLILADNTYQKGYAYVKGYDQFGTEINLAGLTVTCGAGDMTAYDSKTGKLTIESPTQNAYMLMKQVPVFVSYQTGDGIISAQANLEVSTRSFVDEIEFGEIKKDGTPRADGRVTITELASKKYYVELLSVKDQYDNDLSYKDLNDQKAEPVLFVIPGNNSGAYYKTGDFDEIDGTTILWLEPADDPKPGTMDLSITGAGGYTNSIPVTIEDDPYIQTIDITYPQLYAGHSKSADFTFSAVDQYGEDIDIWNVRPGAGADGATVLTFSDKNHMTGKPTEIRISGNVTFNAVVEDTVAKTWTVNLDASEAGAKEMTVLTTLTAGMVPYTKTITIGAQGQAINVLNKLASGNSLELNPYSNTKINFNKALQFEDVNGEVMDRVSSEQYPYFSNDSTITLSETDSSVKMSDYTKFYWYLSDEKIEANNNATLTARNIEVAGTSIKLDNDGQITSDELKNYNTASKKFYVTVVGLAKGKYYKLSEQDFRVTYIPATDIADGVLTDVENLRNGGDAASFDSTATTNKYSASVKKPSIPLYVNSDNGLTKDIELTVTNDTGETYKVPLGDGYRVSTDSGLKIADNGYQVSGKVSGATSGTATIDVWLTQNSKKIDTISLDYSNAAPAPTSVKWNGTQSVTGSNSDSKVGQEFDFTPSTRVETSKDVYDGGGTRVHVGQNAKITAAKGKITITHANNVEDEYTLKVLDQYEQDWTSAEFYVNGIKKDYVAEPMTKGNEYVFKIIAGTVTKEITIVPGTNGSTMTVTQDKSYDKNITVGSSATLVAEAKQANANGTTTITLAKDITLDENLVIESGVKVVTNGYELDAKTNNNTITIKGKGTLEVPAGSLLSTGTGAFTNNANGKVIINGSWEATGAATITNDGLVTGSGHATLNGSTITTSTTGVTNNGEWTITRDTLVLNGVTFDTASPLLGGHVKFVGNNTFTAQPILEKGTTVDVTGVTTTALTFKLAADASVEFVTDNGPVELTSTAATDTATATVDATGTNVAGTGTKVTEDSSVFDGYAPRIMVASDAALIGTAATDYYKGSGTFADLCASWDGSKITESTIDVDWAKKVVNFNVTIDATVRQLSASTGWGKQDAYYLGFIVPTKMGTASEGIVTVYKKDGSVQVTGTLDQGYFSAVPWGANTLPGYYKAELKPTSGSWNGWTFNYIINTDGTATPLSAG